MLSCYKMFASGVFDEIDIFIVPISVELPSGRNLRVTRAPPVLLEKICFLFRKMYSSLLGVYWLHLSYFWLWMTQHLISQTFRPSASTGWKAFSSLAARLVVPWPPEVGEKKKNEKRRASPFFFMSKTAQTFFFSVDDLPSSWWLCF